MGTAVCSVMDEIVMERGSVKDFRAMARWHYRKGLPAAVTRVVVAWHVLEGRRRRAGVGVEAMGVLASRARDEVTGGRYRPATRSAEDVREAARRVNEEIRVISRVVVHPTFRGIGLGVRLVRAMLEGATTEIVEAHAAMGRVNPFFERAGMREVKSEESRMQSGGKIYYWWRSGGRI